MINKLKLLHVFFLAWIGFAMQVNAQESTLLESVRYIDSLNHCNISAEVFDSIYFKLPRVSTSPYKRHIRLNDKGRVYDLYCDENDNFSGVFVAFTYEFRYRKIENSQNAQRYIHQIFFKKYQLNALDVEVAFDFVDSIKIAEIPSDSLIPNWQSGFLHCDGLMFQFSMDKNYSKSMFSCPWGQNDSIPQKSIVLSTHSQFSSLFATKEKYEALESQLPTNSTYSNDGYLFWFYWDVSSKKKKRIRRKQQRS